MLVQEIRDAYDTRGETVQNISISDIELNDDTIKIGDNNYAFDELAEKALAKLTGVNYLYLDRCPTDLKLTNLNHWLREYRDQEVLLHTMGNGIHGLLDPKTKVIPVSKVLDVVESVFQPSDEVSNFIVTDKLTQLDVISDEHRIEVPGYDTPLRPENDITYGGLRVYLPTDYSAPMPPSVETYLNRRVCTNGMCIHETEYKIRLRGSTVDDIIQSMENNARTLMEKLPQRLESYRASADVEVPGNVAQFAYQVGRENGLGQRIQDRVMNMVSEISGTPSMYDMAQAFTYVTQESISFNARTTLEYIGGNLGMNTEAMLHRCTQCERPLVDGS